MAKLYFKYGTMNSGKTALLLQAAFNYEQNNKKVLILKPIIDTKGGEFLVSRIGLKRKVDYMIKKGDHIDQKLSGKLDDIDCIFVDEVQFLMPSQIDELMKIVVEEDIPIICYGLRTDFQTKGFPGATRLLEIAHKIEELKSICTCGEKTVFNIRKVDGKVSFEGDQVAIDLENQVEYDSCCAKCYNKYVKDYKES